MPQIVCGLAALSVAAFYYAHRAALAFHQYRERQLRARVAYMLWVMAKTVH